MWIDLNPIPSPIRLTIIRYQPIAYYATPNPAWAYARMGELMEEKHRLEAASAIAGSPPQIDTVAALAYRKQTERVLANADSSERTLIIRSWVDHIKLAPGSLEVEISYRIPEPVVNSLGAGACFVSMHQSCLERGW